MGNESSAPSGGRPASFGILGESKSLFDVGYDELAFRQSFTSDLFTAPADRIVRPISLPDSDLIADIVCDPTVLTTVDSPAGVLRAVLFPLFEGNEQNKSKPLQILTSFFKFLRDRPTAACESELNARAELLEWSNLDRTLVIHEHNHCADPVAIADVNEKTPQATVIQIIDDLVPSKTKEIAFAASPEYAKMSARLRHLMSGFPTTHLAAACIKWGIFAADLCSLLSAWQFAAALANSTQKEFEFPNYSSLPSKLSLKNCA
jgi:hypothetical protein